MLTIDLAISILLRLVAFGWTIVLIVKIRDKRLVFLALMLGLMVLQQIFTVSKESFTFQPVFLTTELTGLLISILCLFAVAYINNVVHPNADVSKGESIDKLESKYSSHNYLLPIVSLFFILFFVALNYWSIRSIQILTDKHHGDHHDVVFQLVNMNLAIGNAIQESYAYVLSGDIIEKQEFLEWDKEFDEEIEILRRKHERLEHEAEFDELITQLEISKSYLIAISFKLFNEYELNGVVDSKTYIDYEDAIDSLIPKIRELNDVQSEHLLEEYDVTSTLLERGKTVINFSTFVLLITSLAFIAIALVLDNLLKKNSKKIIDYRIAQQRKEQLLLDSIPAMIWQKDDKNNIINLNTVAAQSIGKTVEELKGKNAKELYPNEADAYLQDDLEVIRTNKPKLDYVEPYQAGNKRKWIRTDKYPIGDRKNATGVLVVATDVSAEREMEYQLEKQRSLLMETQQELVHAEKRGLLAQLSSSIAHELNQPLSSASQFCSSFKLRMNKLNIIDDKLTSYLDSIIYQVNRAGEIIRRIKALSKNKTVEKSVYEIGEVLLEATELLKNEIKLNNVKLTITKYKGDLHCKIDKIGIQQVILNVIQNALNSLKNIKENRRINLSIETKDNKLYVSIEDNGVGIKGLDKSAIFAPYATSTESGLGLGLSLSRKILMDNNGTIEVDTQFSPGARFVITLPIVHSEDLVEMPA